MPLKRAIAASPTAEAMARALMHFLWQGALVGIATGGILALLDKAKASTRYAVATGALLLMAALPFATALRTVEPAARPAIAPSAAPAGPVPAAVAPASPANTVTAQTFGAALLPWVFALWLAGVAALSLVHLGGWGRVRRLSRQGQPAGEELQELARSLSRRLGIGRAVALLESAAVTVPAVVGWLRPVVLVPASTLAGLSPRQLEAILAHELAHIRRHDYLVNLLQTAVETLLFYHPAVWWVSAQVRHERENCCDDLVVTVCGDRLGYARALVELEGLRSAAPRLALAATGGSLADRVRRLVGVPDRPSRRPWAAGLLALALLPAGAALQLACSNATTAKEARVGSDAGRTWIAERQEDRLRLTIETRDGWDRWTSVDEYPFSQFSGLTPGAETRFELRRDAGTFRFQGRFDGRRGRGTFTFAADPAFAQEMGGKTATLRLMELALNDIPLSYVREMRALGFARFPESSRRFRPRDLVPDPIREMVGAGDRDQELRQLMEFRRQGVTPELVRAVVAAGYRDLSSSDLVELSAHGIGPAYVQGLSASGYRFHYPFQLVQIHSHGITPEWLRGIVQAGYGDATPEQLVSLHAHGIDGDAIRGSLSQGRRRPTPEELMSLRSRGLLGRS